MCGRKIMSPDPVKLKTMKLVFVASAHNIKEQELMLVGWNQNNVAECCSMFTR